MCNSLLGLLDDCPIRLRTAKAAPPKTSPPSNAMIVITSPHRLIGRDTRTFIPNPPKDFRLLIQDFLSASGNLTVPVVKAVLGTSDRSGNQLALLVGVAHRTLQPLLPVSTIKQRQREYQSSGRCKSLKFKVGWETERLWCRNCGVETVEVNPHG